MVIALVWMGGIGFIALLWWLIRQAPPWDNPGRKSGHDARFYIGGPQRTKPIGQPEPEPRKLPKRKIKYH